MRASERHASLPLGHGSASASCHVRINNLPLSSARPSFAPPEALQSVAEQRADMIPTGLDFYLLSYYSNRIRANSD
ncbi:hypothetical protein EVAR_103742_1 [Eumeta japonica]|uniref:Uncharacterized protein n=1 Tax=Eumeta variegata TaxID=151549 RepID=A0A4C1ZL16_EUMVA|nr:hypothetical protein EVAR_103742_1 [Eumeta japonica]